MRFLLGAWEINNRGLLYVPLTGFYVADLARRGKKNAARWLLAAIHQANALPMDGGDRGFPEFVHGRKLTAGGTLRQGWSAAAAVIGHYALQGRPPFRDSADV